MKRISTTILCAIFISLIFYSEVMGQVTSDDAWINEFHYDNAGGDVGEFVEVVVKNAESYDLSLLRVVLYNGSNGSTYDDYTVDTFHEGSSYGVYTIYYGETSGIQNGDPDGIALSYDGDLIQFLSYEGSFTASGGPADGVTSEDVGVEETTTSSTPVGYSLQLIGSGYSYDDFTWTGPTDESPGSVNEGQFLHPTVQFSNSGATVNETDGIISISVTIENPDNNAVDVDVVFQQNSSVAEGADFTTSTTQTVSFSSGANGGDIINATFTLDNDSDYEGIETAEFILANISTSGDAKIGGQTEYTLTIEDDETPNVVINEVNKDPGQDADGNDILSTADDEFIEIYNNEEVSVDIGEWYLTKTGSTLHTIASGTQIPAKSAIVIFDDSAEPTGNFGGSMVIVGDSHFGLQNDESTITLFDVNNIEIDAVSWSSTSTADKESYTRDPDGTGTFVEHSTAEGSIGDISPGTKVDGSLFTTSLVIEGNAGWRMLSAPVENMPISELTDDTPIQGFGDGYEKNFYTSYDGSTFTFPADLTGNLNSGEGFILYFYNNNDAGSSTLPVVLDVVSNSEPSSDVTVNLHQSGDGWNLLGNPYQIAFDITSISLTSGALASAVGQVWSDEQETYLLTSENDDKVAPGQGFFIQNDNAPSAELPISGKTSGTRFYKSNVEKAFVQLELISEGANGEGEEVDLSAILYFHDEATEEWDMWDAEKLYPLKSNYSILNIIGKRGDDQVAKAQDSRVYENLGEEVFHMNVEAMNVKPQQTLKWKKSQNVPETWTFTLIDNETGEELKMNEDFSYDFKLAKEAQTLKTTSVQLAKSLTVNSENQSPRFTIKVTKGKSTDIETETSPKQFTLEQNYPNPFNPTTVISYQVPVNSDVRLAVYDIIGRKVSTLVDGQKSAGTYQVTFDASGLSSGVYYYRMQSAGQVLTRQMTLIK